MYHITAWSRGFAWHLVVSWYSYDRLPVPRPACGWRPGVQAGRGSDAPGANSSWSLLGAVRGDPLLAPFSTETRLCSIKHRCYVYLYAHPHVSKRISQRWQECKAQLGQFLARLATQGNGPECAMVPRIPTPGRATHPYNDTGRKGMAQDATMGKPNVVQNLWDWGPQTPSSRNAP